jgi:hypothetical protein
MADFHSCQSGLCWVYQGHFIRPAYIAARVMWVEEHVVDLIVRLLAQRGVWRAGGRIDYV